MWEAGGGAGWWGPGGPGRPAAAAAADDDAWAADGPVPRVGSVPWVGLVPRVSPVPWVSLVPWVGPVPCAEYPHNVLLCAPTCCGCYPPATSTPCLHDGFVLRACEAGRPWGGCPQALRVTASGVDSHNYFLKSIFYSCFII